MGGEDAESNRGGIKKQKTCFNDPDCKIKDKRERDWRGRREEEEKIIARRRSREVEGLKRRDKQQAGRGVYDWSRRS